ncbi:receptor-like protein kinase HSL1 [Chenopodium quinoa]|uniref:non-specific serine/threonine protein kinase n=1 Tax=Chenopodium quinoa TaxID=63459 RepID=A0A803LLM4_CHEQI|nr:receptor-like protein kinase HSL1 [Chenopodium quinoa]
MLTIFVFFLLFSLPPPTLSINQEGLYLQHVKQSLDDPNGFFSGWNDSHRTPCNWTGITCDSASGSVTSIEITSANLVGPFPVIVCRLRYLEYLSFYDNYLNSSLPPDISTCQSLRHLDLSQNGFTGNLPDSLSSIPTLEYLDLSYNNFTGEVPATFGSFQKLEVVSLVDNFFSGKFPMFFSNVSTLNTLNLSFNPFLPSRLGPELGKLTNLKYFWATQTNLFDELPDSLGTLKNVLNFDVSQNHLTGKLPSSLTEMTSAIQIELYENKFTGELPLGWKNMKSLLRFDAAMNNLTGTIPDELAQLPLSSFNLYQNQFHGVVPESIADSPNLYEFKIYNNRFAGELPRKLGENSPLNLIDVSFNNFTGELPPNLCANRELAELLVIGNSFSGEIPASLSECKSLTRIRLSGNRFSGNVPSGFWGLPRTSLLELEFNEFTGKIPKSIASASNLSLILISNNSFSGKIPEEIGLLTNLVSFMADNNRFSGSLPDSMLKLPQLERLHLNNNQLSGEISPGIKSLKKLNDFDLGNNDLSGSIPEEIGTLTSLNYLDLSNNRLSGSVPGELQNLKLNEFNLSNNHLSGELPPFYAKEMYKNSFLGNPGLCGDISGLCDSKVEVQRERYLWVLRTIFVLAAIVFLVGVVWFYYKYRNFKQVKSTIDKSKWTLMSFHKLGFSEYEILDCLDEDNVIGSGASGKVYKAVLSNGEAVAVKKLWAISKFAEGGDIENGGVVQDNGFEAEVETLGKIRHKNIVRLWCCCKTKDCKLLVYEYMPNGSLGDLLHGPKSGLLDWPTRYKIALDAAEGLSYLHHDCVPAIVHRDVKSNNILLDAEFGAKVADFGVAKVVDAIGKGTKSMSVIAGSCGYIAPEYAYTLRVNEKSDTYSFGVVILELVTGKKPVDPEYGEKDLVKWVCTTVDQKGVDHVIDQKIDSCFKEDVCKLLNIGLLCTSPLPINRPSMRRVVKMLQEVSGETMSKAGKKDGKLTPYYYEDASDHGSVV